MVREEQLKRVAIQIVCEGDNWIGGMNYYRNLLTCIRLFQHDEIEIVLLAGKATDLHGLEKLATVVRSRLLDWQSRFYDIRMKIRAWLGRDYLLYALMRIHKIDVLSHSGVLWKGCSIKSLPWIPDFQHKYYPEFFDTSELEARDRSFATLTATADAVLCSSQAAAADLRKFFGPDILARVLRFVVAMPASESESRDGLAAKYGLDRAWFHLPNQLWKHKNHIVVIEALWHLKEAGEPVPMVVSTGPTKDRRNPGHFQFLQDKLDSYGLADRFRILGKVPYEDMVGLMVHAIAVVNPSLFEGWSTTVEESKSLGKLVILSNIDVHVEQNPARAEYFESGNVEQLASIMLHEATSFDEAAEPTRMREASAQMDARKREFASCYRDIVYGLFDA